MMQNKDGIYSALKLNKVVFDKIDFKRWGFKNNAILMPYLRSEVSLLTAQPETDCVVLPVFNINKMLEE